MARRGTRRSQVVVPFGIGAIIEFEDEALMPAGLEFWPTEGAEKIFDNRLARRLGVNHFLLPPPKPERNSPPGTTAPIPHVRFPQWHFCPRCRGLKRAELHDERRPRCSNSHASPRLSGRPTCSSLPDKRKPFMLPLRFVAVCPEGHIEDFPWNAWVHSTKDGDLNADSGCIPECLYFYATQLSGLMGLIVSCGTCGEKRPLLGATSPHGLKGWTCSGKRPWLGEGAKEQCNAPPNALGQASMFALQRAASNLYFPEVASSILIPPYSTRVAQILSDPKNIEALESAKENGKIPDSTFRVVATMHNVDFSQLKRAFLERIGEVDDEAVTDESAFRFAEFQALHEERRDTQDDLVTRPQELKKYASVVRDNVAVVTLVEQLAETRALIGFSRINPDTAKMAKLSARKISWRPAFRVFGEGIFISFDLARIEEFEENPSPPIQRLMHRANEWGRSVLPVNPSFIFLHTLSHLMIKRLSFEAGYGASSIRERIYSSSIGTPNEMAGILLYTAAGDADGTLGGLVGLGKPGNLERILLGALDDARWCASDPICRESDGQGPDGLNLAACHACALLPETSCEFQNRLLDRGVVEEFFKKYML